MQPAPEATRIPNLASAHVYPAIALDSQGDLFLSLYSERVVSLCFRRLSSEPLTPAAFLSRMEQDRWVMLSRNRDGVYFVTLQGLDPVEDASVLTFKPEDQEAIHVALEMGLALWPEWGNDLRDRMAPVAPILLGQTGRPITA